MLSIRSKCHKNKFKFFGNTQSINSRFASDYEYPKKPKSQKEIDTELYEHHMMQGHMAFNAENWSNALEHYIKANKHNTKSCQPVGVCAAIYEKKGELENTIAASRLAIKMAKKTREDSQFISNEQARMGRMYFLQEKYLEAQKAFTEAYLYHPTPEYAEERLSEVEAKLKVDIKFKKVEASDMKIQSQYYKEITNGLPVQIDFKENKGRGLYVTKSFNAGDSLFAEAPVVASVDFLNKSNEFCAGSFHPLKEPEVTIPRELEQVLKVCDMDYKAIIKQNIEANENYITPNIKKCDKCGLKFTNAEAEKAARDDWLSIICQGECGTDSRLKILLPSFFDKSYSFEKEEYIPLYQDLSSLELLSIMIMKISKDEDLWYNYFKFLVYAEKTPDRLMLDHEILHYTTLKEMFPSLSWLLSEKNYLRLKEMVGLNAFTINTTSIDFVVSSRGEDLENIQLDVKPEVSEKEVRCNAIYKAGSFMNHSCSPNVEIARPSWSTHVTWIALKDIKEGEELLCAYLPEVKGDEAQEERRNLLFQKYGFLCQGECELCLYEKAAKDDAERESRETKEGTELKEINTE
jgi:tetratricopeptide (TPR) repeat protein